MDATVRALRAGDLPAVGRLLTASHRSSQHLFANSTPELDFLVDALTAQPHVFGARLTGGGFGGAVMALAAPAFTADHAAQVATAYAARFGTAPDVLPVEVYREDDQRVRDLASQHPALAGTTVDIYVSAPGTSIPTDHELIRTIVGAHTAQLATRLAQSSPKRV